MGVCFKYMHIQQTLSHHYEQLLGLSEPWIIDTVHLNTDTSVLNIHVSVSAGTRLRCPKCGALCSIFDYRAERTWRHLDTMQYQTYIIASIPRITCSQHGIISTTVPWAEPYGRFTVLFEAFAISVLESCVSITAAQHILGISWDQIHHIQKRAVQRGWNRRKEHTYSYIGIDEKSMKKKHAYVSIMTDITQRCVINVVPTRTREATALLLNTLSERQKTDISAVAMDMWKPYMGAVHTYLPHADIVHDKYHITTYLTKAVDMVRKREQGIRKDTVLTGTKYIWLTNPEQWTTDQRALFDSVSTIACTVSKAWTYKETFKAIWESKSIEQATILFNRWYFKATHSRIKPIIKAAKTVKRHITGIYNYIKHRITNATTEGLNSGIQLIKSNARGFRNFENYKTAILFRYGKLDLYP